MKNKTNILFASFIALWAMMLTACTDDDNFTTSKDYGLSWQNDTLSLDTVFSTVPSPHKVFMIYNNSGEGIRISNATLEKGKQSGFRVNINGTELSNSKNTVKDMEIRNGDSIRVFVEITSLLQQDTLPRLVTDNLLLNLESGRTQKVVLTAYSWDALLLKDVTFNTDTTLSNDHGRPVVIYGDIKVPKNVTLHIAPDTKLYFHSKAGMDIAGTLKAKGEANKEIVFRCDRLDRMVSNLTYDNNPGQWGGIRFRPTSFDNEIDFADIHGATTAVLCDSSNDATRQKLTITHSTIHNTKSNGLKTVASKVTMENCQVSNALDTCVILLGGDLDMNHCTIAQYFAIEQRGKQCLYFANAKDTTAYPLKMNIRNSIIKGYDDDNLLWSYGGRKDSIDATFANCLLRAVMPTDDDKKFFVNCTIEDPANETSQPENFFELFDTKNFLYNFKPKAGTQAVGIANPETSLPDDRLGNTRSKEHPDVGCFETTKE